MSKFEKNLTDGSVTKQLIAFSLPFLLSNFIQASYNVADMLIISWFAGPSSVAGVANGGQVLMLVISLVLGLAMGGSVLIGQYYGARKEEELKKTIGTTLSLLLILSIVLTVLFIALSDPILRLLQTPEESFQDAKNYFNISMLGSVFLFGYNAISAILRGLGDSKNPLYFVLVACVANVVLDFILIGWLQMGATGAAIATVLAQAISLILSVLYLAKNRFIFDFKRKSFRIDKVQMKLILKIGVPTSVQNVVVSLSFLIMMALVNGYGLYAAAAMGIVGKFNSFAILPAIAMSSSVGAMAAQNLGAGLPDRAKQTMLRGIQIVFPVGVAFFLFAFFAPAVIMRFFTDSPEVIEQGTAYVRLFSIDYLVVPFTFCANGLLIGAGHTTFSMLNGMLSSVFLRIPIALLFGSVLDLGLGGIGLAAPVASAGALLVSVLYIKSGRWLKRPV